MHWAADAAAGATLIMLLAALAVAFRGIDWRGAAVGSLIAASIHIGFGFRGVALLALFVALGLIRWRGKRHSVRSVRHILANGSIGALLGVSAALFPDGAAVWTAAFAGSIAAASADTVSSEAGQAWGGRPVLITTLRPTAPGENGGVTLIGLLAGAAAAGLVGCAALLLGWRTPLPAVFAGGVAGNLADSLLGALLERRGLIGNSAVNFACAGVGAAVSAALV